MIAPIPAEISEHLVEKARSIATHAHRNQTRKNSKKPYIMFDKYRLAVRVLGADPDQWDEVLKRGHFGNL